MFDEETRQLCGLFAEVLDYPGGSLLASATECARRLKDCCPEAAAGVEDLAAFAEREGLARLEEVYTRTFDITPTTTLYVGYHLFGESHQRGAFLVQLQQAYREQGLSWGSEVADHLCLVLRFASVAQDPEFVIPLIGEGVLPALEKMETAFRSSPNCYGQVIDSLKCFLGQRCRELATAGGLRDD